VLSLIIKQGLQLILLGLALASGDGATALRLVLLAALFIAIGPRLSNLSASAAHAGGLTPKDFDLAAKTYSLQRPPYVSGRRSL